MRFQVFLSLWSVTSCSCIDKIPEVAKTKVSKPKTCLRHGVGRFAKHCPNVYAKKEGRSFILVVVLLLPPASCRGDAVFCCQSIFLVFQKMTQLETSG